MKKLFTVLVFLLLLQMIIGSCYRLCFYYLFSPPGETFFLSNILFWKASYLGAKFDLRLALIFLSPMLLLAWIPLIRLKFWSFYLLFGQIIFTVAYLSNFGHFSYLNVPLNSSVLGVFLTNPLTSLRMVWESYPVIWISFIVGFFWSFYFILVRKIFSYSCKIKNFKFKLHLKILISSLFVLIWVLGIYGNLAYYPLRWGQAYFTSKKFYSAMVFNPFLYFIDTLEFKDHTSYDKVEVKKYWPAISNYLKIDSNNKKVNFSRLERPKSILPKTTGPTPNVVIIVMESLAAYKTGLFGNPLNPTPYFDQIAKESWLFNKFYVPTQVTARSIYALITGIPDTTSNESSSRNPMKVNQHTIFNEFTEHDKFYFYGGNANWGNIRALLANNINGLNIVDEGEFSFPRNDVWGISDYHLFMEANLRFKDQKKPFLALIQTSGFHRPYTIPDIPQSFNIKKFEGPKKLADLKKYGFISAEEYNSMRFQDMSLGNFIDLARKEAYFSNTIFVVIGDHGLTSNNAKHLSEGQIIHDLENFHTPLIFFGPKFFTPKTNDQMVSEIDLLPSLAHMLGIPYRNTTLGRSFFDPKYRDESLVFFYYWYLKPASYSLVGRDYILTYNCLKMAGLHQYNSDKPLQELKTKYPEKFQKMLDLAHGLYYSSQFLMFNNPRLF